MNVYFGKLILDRLREKGYLAFDLEVWFYGAGVED